MTGLDLGRDDLIEVAALVTDPDLNVLGDGVDVVIHADEAALAAMPEIVRTMHAKSGLTEEVRRSAVTLAEAEDMVLEYVTQLREGSAYGAAVRQLDRHRPGLHRPGHAPPRRAPALPDDRRLVDQGAVPPLVPAGVLRPARRRGWRTGRWPTSGRASGSWSTTGARSSCRCPARTWRRRKAIAAELCTGGRAAGGAERTRWTRHPRRGVAIIGPHRPGAVRTTADVVAVAQLAEHRVVVPVVVGSIPISHPDAHSSTAQAPSSRGGLSRFRGVDTTPAGAGQASWLTRIRLPAGSRKAQSRTP